MSYCGRSEGCYGNKRRLQRIHARRSNRAKKIDESLRAPLAKSSEQWLKQPNRFDIPNVDTPKHREPERRHKLYGNTHWVNDLTEEKAKKPNYNLTVKLSLKK